MADQDPVFQIQRVYLKEASLEQPNSRDPVGARTALSGHPAGCGGYPGSDGIYEVCVTATVRTKIKDRTVFLVEARQAGIFEIRNLPQEQLGHIMGIACPKSSTPTCAATWPI